MGGWNTIKKGWNKVGKAWRSGAEIGWAERKGWLPKGTQKYIRTGAPGHQWLLNRFSAPRPKIDYSRFSFVNEDAPSDRNGEIAYSVILATEITFAAGSEGGSVAYAFLGHMYMAALQFLVFEVRSLEGGDTGIDSKWTADLVPYCDFGAPDVVKNSSYARVELLRDEGPSQNSANPYIEDPTGVFVVVSNTGGDASSRAFVTATFSTTKEDVEAFDRGLASGINVPAS